MLTHNDDYKVDRCSTVDYNIFSRLNNYDRNLLFLRIYDFNYYSVLQRLGSRHIRNEIEIRKCIYIRF